MNVAVNPISKRANRLQTTKLNNRMVNDYWEGLFRAPEEGRQVCWYEGVAINPFIEAADVAWVHGEAWPALLAARNKEGPQEVAEKRRLRSRTVLLCTHPHRLRDDDPALEGRRARGPPEQFARTPAARGAVPVPDFFISAYPYC